MLHLREVAIIKAWKFAGEHDRIHYILRVNTNQRHLYADRGDALFTELERVLDQMKYQGPASEKERVNA